MYSAIMSCNYPNTVCKDWFTRLRVYCSATVGASPALSKAALCTWLDNIDTQIAHDEPRVFNNSGQRQHGVYHNLKQRECVKVIGLISTLRKWGSECSSAPAPVSCGSLFMTVPEGRSRVTQEQLEIGPFF